MKTGGGGRVVRWKIEVTNHSLIERCIRPKRPPSYRRQYLPVVLDLLLAPLLTHPPPPIVSNLHFGGGLSAGISQTDGGIHMKLDLILIVF